MPTFYKAPKPTYTTKDWAWYLASRCLVVPLLWDICQAVGNFLFGWLLARYVLMAQSLSEPSADAWYSWSSVLVTEHRVRQLNQYSRTHCFNKVLVETHDGAGLDTIEIIPKKTLKDEAPKYVIHMNANMDCYENNMLQMQQDASILQATVIGFNYRGVRQSTGYTYSKDHLLFDGIAQVQRLLDMGVKPDDIIIKGQSLGSAVGTLVAQHFHRLGYPIKIFNDRSFSNLTNFAVGHIRSVFSATGHKESTGMKIIGWILKPLIKCLLYLFNWEMEAGDAFKEIPKTHREYTVVRSGKEGEIPERMDERVDDQIIPHYASIHAALKSERRQEKREIKEAIVTASDEGRQEDVLQLQRELLAIKSRKLVTSDASTDGHNAALSSLTSRGDLSTSGEDLFYQFVQQPSNP